MLKERTDVLLVTVPEGSKQHRSVPVGIASIGAVLKQEGYKVKVKDYASLDMNLNQAIKEIKKLNPRILGVTLTSDMLRRGYELVKKLNSEDIEILLGGAHATASSSIQRIEEFDHIFKGEAENKILEVTESILSGSDKRVFRGKPVEDLDSLPVPLYSSLPIKKYFYPTTNKITAYVEASRGCPFSCKFCSINKNKTRFKSPERVIEEIKRLNELGVGFIEFSDCTFGMNKSHTLRICQLLIEEDLDINWGAQTRVDMMDEELLEKMSEAGCKMVSFGIESGSEDIRDQIGKDFTDKEIKEVFKTCRKFGIETGALFILGFPGEAKKDIKETIKLSKEIDADYANFNPLILYPSTYYYQKAIEEGKIKRGIWEKNILRGKKEVPIYTPEKISKNELNKMTKRAWREFYFRPKYILKKISRIRGLGDVKRYIYYLKNYLLQSLTNPKLYI